MDTAGTIIGAISLSITLCQGITTYCHDWKHQDDDVRSLRSLCAGLEKHLQAIDQVAKGHPTLNSDAIGGLDDALETCKGHCDAVLSLSEKYADGKPAVSWKGKAREGARKLKFPFQKKTLQELKDIMVAFRGNIDGILQLLSLDNVLSFREDAEERHAATLEEIQSTGNLVSHTVTTEVGRSISATEGRLSRQLDFSIAREVRNSTNSVEASVSSSTVEILSAINAQSQMTQQLSMALASLVTDDSGIPMPLLSTSGASGDAGAMVRIHQGKRKKPRGGEQRLAEWMSANCTCNYTVRHATSTRSNRLYGWIFSRQEDGAVHERHCPLWYQSHVTTQYDVRFAILRNLGAFGSLNISGSPYRSFFGWGISQSLAFKPIVPNDSPAFRVIAHHFGIWADEVDARACMGDLMAVFQSGQGSPTDTLLNGTTLLGYAFSQATAGGHLAEIWTMTLELLARDSRIIDEFGRNNMSAWDTLHGQILRSMWSFGKEKSMIALDFLTWLADGGIGMAPPSQVSDGIRFNPEFSAQHPRHVLEALRSREIFRDVGCGVLSTAVVRQNRLAVERILRGNPELLTTEQDVFGYTPIHYAIGWVEGLRLLLDITDETALAEIANSSWSTPFDLVRAYNCTDSFRLLLDAGMPFSLYWLSRIGRGGVYPNVSDMVVEAAVELLEQLFEFAKGNLPAEVFASLNITEALPIRENPKGLFDALRSEGVQLPTRFRRIFQESENSLVLSGTIYHICDIKYSTVVKLFEAGLTNIDYAVQQITPLMGLFGSSSSRLQLIRLTEFFVERGGRLDHHIPSYVIGGPVSDAASGRGFLVIHRLSGIVYGIGGSLYDGSVLEDLELVRSRIWRDILQSRISDPCRCACASDGCRPISLALKSLTNQSAFAIEGREAMSEFIRRTSHLIGGLEGDQLVEDVMRYLSFTALGLTHTCCRYTLPGHMGFHNRCNVWIKLMEATEIEEIRQEEIGLIGRLDSLVDGFVRDFRKGGLSLGQFILGPWQETMLEELSAKDDVPEPVREQWKELGVMVGPVESTAQGEDVGASTLSYEDYARERTRERKRAYDEWMDGIRRSIRPV